MATWPDAGLAVWSELRRFPGRAAFIVGDEGGLICSRMADLAGARPLDVGKVLTENDDVPSERSVVKALAGHPVLTRTEILFDEVLRIHPIRLISLLATGYPPVAVVWPGSVDGAVLRYPAIARSGQVNEYRAPGCLVLRAIETVFDDDAPFRVERV